MQVRSLEQQPSEEEHKASLQLSAQEQKASSSSSKKYPGQLSLSNPSQELLLKSEQSLSISQNPSSGVNARSNDSENNNLQLEEIKEDV